MAKVISIRKYLQAFNIPIASLFLILFLSIDLAFIIKHCVDVFTPGDTRAVFMITKDGGYPEKFQYLKMFWIIALLTLVSWKKRSLRYITWEIIFIYFLADDSLEIHEKVGKVIAEKLDFIPPLGLRLQDIGELVTTAIAGICLLFLLVWSYKNGTKVFRKISQDLCLLILVLAFFGIVVDMLHSMVKSDPILDLVFAVTEDGGEMFVLSFIFWYIFVIYKRTSSKSYYLSDLFGTFLR